jgi:ribosomal protein S18 acetylase RimI-like enzyme
MLTERLVATADLDLVCRHREALFRASMRPDRSDAALAEMTAAFRPWLAPRLADGTYFGTIVEDAGLPVAGIGLMAIDWPPHPSHPSQDRRGYVLNLYVEPSHRRRGLGKRLMALAEAEFRRRGIAYAVLHATEMGRPLYEEAGWVATSEMARALA